MDTLFKEQLSASWAKITEKLMSWGDAFILNLPNMLLAIILFSIAYWLSSYVKNWVNKILKTTVKEPSVRNLAATLSSTIVIGLGFVLALSVLNLNDVLTSILAGAGVAGLAVGLALQGTLANTFSGIFLSIRDVLSIGDWVETNGYSGTVLEIDLRNTKITEPDNNVVVIPNQMILENPFKNYGLTQRIRTTIVCGVGYESDLEAVSQLAIDTITELYPPNPGENVEFYYTDFGGSSIDFKLRFWVNATKKLNALEAKSKAIMAIKKAFDQNKVDIPYPIRTLQMEQLQVNLSGNNNNKDKEQHSNSLN